jgi:hypothetical protein
MSDVEFELKERFAELRADDETNAPAFEAIRDRGLGEIRAVHTVRRRARWVAPALLAVAAAVLAAVWATTRVSRQSDRAGLEALMRDSSTDVFRWTMPTDGLLRSARQTLQTPALSASVLDAAAVPIPGTPFKGD